jgi:hypothetical protein
MTRLEAVKPTHRHPTVLLALLCTASFMTTLDVFIVNVGLRPPIGGMPSVPGRSPDRLSGRRTASGSARRSCCLALLSLAALILRPWSEGIGLAA